MAEQGVTVVEADEIDDLRSGGATAIEEARRRALAINDGETLAKAANYLLDAATAIKRIKERLKKPKDTAKAAWQNWVDLEKQLMEPYERIRFEIIEPAMLAFEEKQRREREAVERVQREKRLKEAEDAKLAAAQQAQDAGHPLVADAILDDPVMDGPVTIPKAEAPAGISYRETWSFEVVNLSMVPREYLMLDEKKIGGVVRAM